MQELVLGTAQWGNGYGITNERGRLDDADLASIMAVALDAGVTSVDTAAGYGDAETRLAPWAAGLAITTKVAGAHPVRTQLVASLAALGVSRVERCLLHDWPSLDDDRAASAVAELTAVQDEGLVGAIGVSAYEEADLDRALAVFAKLDVAQVPVSVLDRRLVGAHAVARIVASGGVIQARSVFLQGLLAGRSTTALGQHPAVIAFHDTCAAAGRDPLAVALAYVAGLDWVAQVVVGATSGRELGEIVAAWGAADRSIPDISEGPLDLVDPRRW